MDNAIPTSVLHACWFGAQWQAVARLMLNGARSASMVHSQVWHGRPDRQFQTLGKGATLAWRVWLWSMEGLAWVMWQRTSDEWYGRCLWVVAGRCIGRPLLEMRAFQEIHSRWWRHHWSNASRFLTSCRAGDHVLAPQRMMGGWSYYRINHINIC